MVRSRAGNSRSGDVYFRLGEAYWEQAGYEYLVACQRFLQEATAHQEGKLRHEPIRPSPDYSRAIDYYERLIAEYPNYARIDEALYHLGVSYIADGKPGEGVPTLQRVVKDFPNSRFASRAHFALAEHHLRNENLLGAKTHYERIANEYKTFPVHNLVLYRLGGVFLKLYDVQNAVDVFKMAAPDHSPDEIVRWILERTGILDTPSGVAAVEVALPQQAAEARYLAAKKALGTGDDLVAACHYAVLERRFSDSGFVGKAEQLWRDRGTTPPAAPSGFERVDASLKVKDGRLVVRPVGKRCGDEQPPERDWRVQIRVGEHVLADMSVNSGLVTFPLARMQGALKKSPDAAVAVSITGENVPDGSAVSVPWELLKEPALQKALVGKLLRAAETVLPSERTATSMALVEIRKRRSASEKFLWRAGKYAAGDPALEQRVREAQARLDYDAIRRLELVSVEARAKAAVRACWKHSKKVNGRHFTRLRREVSARIIMVENGWLKQLAGRHWIGDSERNKPSWVVSMADIETELAQIPPKDDTALMFKAAFEEFVQCAATLRWIAVGSPFGG